MYTKTSSTQVVEWQVNQHCWDHLHPHHQGTEKVLEMVYSPFNHLMRLLTQEYFTEFSHWESFKLHIIHKFYWTLYSEVRLSCSSSFMFRAPSIYLGCTAAWRLIVLALYSILTVPTFAARRVSASYTTRELQAAKSGNICGRETWPVILPRQADFHDAF